jgi:hypothetical protein
MTCTGKPRLLIPATWGPSRSVWSHQPGTIQTCPYQLLWQDVRSGSHSGGGQPRHDESLFSGVSPYPPRSSGQRSGRIMWLGASVDMGQPQGDRGCDWVAQSISENRLVAVTDGSYIKEHYSNLCSAAFMLECTQRCGCAIGAFSKAAAANAFGENYLA